MITGRTLLVLSATALLAACAAPTAPTPTPVAAPVAKAQPVPKKAAQKRTRVRSRLAMGTGTYRCDLNRRVVVQSVSSDRTTAVLSWQKRRYRMQAVNTASGALRYEDRGSGLTWITVVGKSMLLDTRRGKQLANDCKA